MLELPGGERWAIEVKRSRAAKLGRGFYEACEDLKPVKRFVVCAGIDSGNGPTRYPISSDVEAIGLLKLADVLSVASKYS